MTQRGAGHLRHVVVLMLENRSFDHLLGYLDHPDPTFEGVPTPAPTNRWNPDDPTSEAIPTEMRRRVRLRVDPDHSHEAVMGQLGLSGSGSTDPTNSGFVRSYEEKATGAGPGPRKARRARVITTSLAVGAGLVAAVCLITGHLALGLTAAGAAAVAVVVRFRFVPATDHYPGDGRRIMRCWAPAGLPALTELAKGFAVCTRWFCSVPGETWPNRQFLHAATSAGTVDIVVKPYDDRTLFELVEDSGGDWRIYYDGPAQVLCYPKLWVNHERLARWHPIQDLYGHIERGELPTYTFIEPNHGYIGRSYSQHVGNNRRTSADFRRADRFVAGVYDALRKNPELFARTVLLITWDEHGGTFDHVPPPETVSPDDRHAGAFHFTRLGPRVPAVVVSPWIAPLTVDHTTYDHASVAATVRTCFAPGASALTERDRSAADFLHLLDLPVPRSDAALPRLRRRPWRPRAAWTPLASFIGWLASLGRPPEPLHESLARVSAHVDAAVPSALGARPAAATPVVPPPPPAPRRTAARAMRKLARAAAEVRGAPAAS